MKQLKQLNELSLNMEFLANESKEDFMKRHKIKPKTEEKGK